MGGGGGALATSGTELRSQKSSAARCPTASISDAASSVGLVSNARVKVPLNKNTKNNPPRKKTLRFLIGAKTPDIYISRLL